MFNAFESSLIVTSSIAGALLLLWQLRRVWPPLARKQHNDLIGWQIGFLATSYAVISAFMLSGVWHDYQSAEANTEVEANSLILLHRMADGISAPSGAQLKSLTRRYADSVITDEWPAMNKGLPNDSGARLLQSMWKVAIQIQPQIPREQIMGYRAVAELASLAEHYRVRQYQAVPNCPAYSGWCSSAAAQLQLLKPAFWGWKTTGYMLCRL